jgi:hypothetical protein
MDIGPDDFTDPPYEVDPDERKVSAKKLFITLLVVLICGSVLLPVLSFAFENGWLRELGIAFLILLFLVLGLHAHQKSKRRQVTERTKK